MTSRTASWITLALGACLLRPTPVIACAALGASGPVSIEGEEALIVWDPEQQTEHFIRQAFFENAPADFGFLVPTPSKPELAEAADGFFERLFEVYRAPVPKAQMSPLRGIPTNGPQPAAAVVQVVEQKRVAGLDAAVLLASDVGALDAWLAKNKYPNGAGLRAWLKPYVDHGYHVTAFRIASDGARALSSTAVRMSFKTKQPMFPYSEPSQAKRVARPFRLSVVAPTKMAGWLGNSEWQANLGYAKPIDLSTARTILGHTLPNDLVRAGWLTVFDEPKSLRGAIDLELRPAQNQKKVEARLSTRIHP